jgi:subtilisin family serine protease
MNQAIVRRFQVRAPDAAAVARCLKAAQGPEVTVDIDPQEPAAGDVLTVRVLGTAKATAGVRNKVPVDARVSRDLIDLPPSPEAHKRIYPDPRVYARIDPDGTLADPPPPGPAIVVAIVDSGITTDHPKLMNNLWSDKNTGKHGACCMSDVPTDDITDQAGHGTMLAGTILATAGGTKKVELMAVKIFDAINEPKADSAARGIGWAVDHGAHIINLSFDLGIGSQALQDAIEYACARDVLVVFAAGNTGSDNDKYRLVPARYADRFRDMTLVVMASDWYDERPTFSNFGTQTVDLAAPGVRITSTRARWTKDEKYAVYTGTSAAAAHVSGALALLKARYPGQKPKDLRDRLLRNAQQGNDGPRPPRLRCRNGAQLRLA